MTARHVIRWDKGRQQWMVMALPSWRRVGAFDSLHQAETWILDLPHAADVVLDLAELDPERVE